MPSTIYCGTPAVLGTLGWPADRFIGGLEEMDPDTGGGDSGGDGGRDGDGIAGGGDGVLRHG